MHPGKSRQESKCTKESSKGRASSSHARRIRRRLPEPTDAPKHLARQRSEDLGLLRAVEVLEDGVDGLALCVADGAQLGAGKAAHGRASEVACDLRGQAGGSCESGEHVEENKTRETRTHEAERRSCRCARPGPQRQRAVDLWPEELLKDVAEHMLRIRPLSRRRVCVLVLVVLVLLRSGAPPRAKVVPPVAALARVVRPTARVGAAQLVVRLAALWVREGVVRVGDGLELDGRGLAARVVGWAWGDAVRVAAERGALVGCLDLVKSGRVADACACIGEERSVQGATGLGRGRCWRGEEGRKRMTRVGAWDPSASAIERMPRSLQVCTRVHVDWL